MGRADGSGEADGPQILALSQAFNENINIWMVDAQENKDNQPVMLHI